MVQGWKNTGLLNVVFHTKVSMQKEAMGEGRVGRAVFDFGDDPGEI